MLPLTGLRWKLYRLTYYINISARNSDAVINRVKKETLPTNQLNSLSGTVMLPLNSDGNFAGIPLIEKKVFP